MKYFLRLVRRFAEVFLGMVIAISALGLLAFLPAWPLIVFQNPIKAWGFFAFMFMIILSILIVSTEN